ncbi:hypothetical protein VTJ49DRAFT_1675 [Mycothermus thermophilus]|uniref:Uncharacterized protein n=1 Tax=Humicola insolens TaxID=85995 RepID=A0ABR3VCB6_HUMIN
MGDLLDGLKYVNRSISSTTPAAHRPDSSLFQLSELAQHGSEFGAKPKANLNTSADGNPNHASPKNTTTSSTTTQQNKQENKNKPTLFNRLKNLLKPAQPTTTKATKATTTPKPKAATLSSTPTHDPIPWLPLRESYWSSEPPKRETDLGTACRENNRPMFLAGWPFYY